MTNDDRMSIANEFRDQLNSIRTEIEQIASLRIQDLLLTSECRAEHSSDIKDNKESKVEVENINSNNRRPSAVARLTSLLTAKIARAGSKRKLSTESTNQEILRKASTDSNASCVVEHDKRRSGGDTNQQDALGSEVATMLLKCLAPIISSLQALGNDLSGSNDVKQESKTKMRELCEILPEVLNRLSNEATGMFGKESIEAHDEEMMQLVLKALIKRVKAEQTRLKDQTDVKDDNVELITRSANSPHGMKTEIQPQAQNLPTVNESRNPTMTITMTPATSIQDIQSSNTTPSPSRQASLSFPQHHSNPFILHSTQLLLSPHQKPRNPTQSPKAINGVRNPVLINGNTGRSFSSFAGGSQTSTWAINDIVRLGSFQNSALFSPSPIAVRRVNEILKT